MFVLWWMGSNKMKRWTFSADCAKCGKSIVVYRYLAPANDPPQFPLTGEFSFPCNFCGTPNQHDAGGLELQSRKEAQERIPSTRQSTEVQPLEESNF